VAALRHLTYANVTATAALFVALGGTAYGALQVNTEDIVNAAVTSAKLASNSVGANKIADGAVTADAIAAKSIKPAAMNTSSRFKINVDDAKTLGGKAAKSYIVGRFASGAFSSSSASPKTIAELDGVGKIGVGCNDGHGFGRFTNQYGKSAVVTIWSSGNPVRSSTISSGGAINGPQDNGAQMQTWQIRYGDATSSQVATIWFVFVSGAENSCAGSAQALAG
jgi:hypothetical protein